MTKRIQSFESWGYIVDPDAKGFKDVTFSTNEKHCNIFHPAAVDPTVPINTFAITGNRAILKIPRVFNDSFHYDRRPKGQKLPVRDQIVSYWSLVENRDLKDLKQLAYTAVIERNLRDRMEEVYEIKGIDEFDELTLQSTDPLFQLLLSTTPFLAGAQKMLNEYADKFAGKTIRSCTFEPIGGFALYDFTISLTGKDLKSQRLEKNTRCRYWLFSVRDGSMQHNKRWLCRASKNKLSPKQIVPLSRNA